MPETKVLSAGAIVTLAKKRIASQQDRIGTYHKLLQAYNDQSPGTNMDVLPNYGDGRPAMKVIQNTRQDLLGRKGAPNFIKPVVKDLASIYGVLPDITVPAEGDAAEAQDMAIKRTRALRQVIEHSHLASQQAHLGFCVAGLGEAVLTLDVLTPAKAAELQNPGKPPGVYMNVVSPVISFPGFIGGRNSREVDDLVIADSLDAEDAKKQYGVQTGEPKVMSYTYYSKAQRTVVVADRQVEHVQHDLGFCPAQWVAKEVTDGKLGTSDIASAVELHYELQALYYMFVDSIAWATYPLIVVQGGQQAMGQASVEIGPGSQVTVGQGGGVHIEAPQANPQAAQMIFQTAFDNFMKVVGVAPIRVEGAIHKSNVTGRAVNNMQAPMQSRINQAYIVMGDAIESAFSMVMRMYAEVKELRRVKTFPLYGSDEGGLYNDTFSGDDFKGWVRNAVKWDSFIGSDHTERLHNALLMYQANPAGYPWRRVLEEAGEDDPDKLIAEAEEAAKKIQEMQQGGQPQGPGAPPGGPGGDPSQGGPPPGMSPPGGAPAPDAGPPGAPPGMSPDAGGPAQPPPQMPDFPPTSVPPGQEGVPTPPPVPDVMGALHEAIANVTIRGQILDGPRPYPGGVYVLLSDPRDIKAVKDALAPVVAQVLGPDAKVTVKAQKKGQ